MAKQESSRLNDRCRRTARSVLRKYPAAQEWPDRARRYLPRNRSLAIRKRAPETLQDSSWMTEDAGADYDAVHQVPRAMARRGAHPENWPGPPKIILGSRLRLPAENLIHRLLIGRSFAIHVNEWKKEAIDANSTSRTSLGHLRVFFRPHHRCRPSLVMTACAYGPYCNRNLIYMRIMHHLRDLTTVQVSEA